MTKLSNVFEKIKRICNELEKEKEKILLKRKKYFHLLGEETFNSGLTLEMLRKLKKSDSILEELKNKLSTIESESLITKKEAEIEKEVYSTDLSDLESRIKELKKAAKS